MDKLLLDCLKKCVEALQSAVDNAKTMTDSCRSSCLVAILACKEAIKNPTEGTCSVACEEAGECVWMLRDCGERECLDAAIACMACSEATSQKAWGNRTANSNKIRRYINVDKASINREAKTIPLSFSSETPAIQRADNALSPEIKRAAGLNDGDLYIEILDHSPENVDLSILKNRGAFLDEHTPSQQIGVIEQVELGADKICRAVVRCGSDTLGTTRFTQMAEGVRTHISVGYGYTKFVGNETLPDGRTAKRFAWVASEVSSVAIPADGTIGVARSYSELPKVDSQTKARANTAHTINMPEIDENKVRADERDKTRSATLSEERARTAEISLIADTLIKDHGKKDGGQMADKIRSIANEALTKGMNIPDFKSRCWEDIVKAKPAEQVRIADCTEDPNRYSLLRGIQSALKKRDGGGVGIPDGLEGEVHQEIMRKANANGGLGYDSVGGFQVPHDAPMRLGRSSGAQMRRDMQATVFQSGGAFVPTTLQLPIIEILRNMEVLSRLGIRTMAGLQGNILIPRQEAAATAYSVSEIGTLTDTAQVLGQIAMSPKRVGATQTYSRQFVMQSAPDAEAFMRDDLLKVIALRLDYLGLNGQGAADEPLGVFNTPGIGTIVFGTTPTYGKMVDMETTIRSANVVDNLAYISTPAVRGSLKKVAEALTGATTIGGSQNAIWKSRGGDEGEVNGYLALASNQIPNNLVALGAWEQLIKAMWGGMEVVVDIFTKAKQAEVAITMNTWVDYALRHPQAFVVSADAGNQ